MRRFACRNSGAAFLISLPPALRQFAESTKSDELVVGMPLKKCLSEWNVRVSHAEEVHMPNSRSLRRAKMMLQGSRSSWPTWNNKGSSVTILSTNRCLVGIEVDENWQFY